ncbi:MAG: hypothetical protein Q9163_002142 [Psora crenata]
MPKAKSTSPRSTNRQPPDPKKTMVRYLRCCGLWLSFSLLLHLSIATPASVEDPCGRDVTNNTSHISLPDKLEKADHSEEFHVPSTPTTLFLYGFGADISARRYEQTLEKASDNITDLVRDNPNRTIDGGYWKFIHTFTDGENVIFSIGDFREIGCPPLEYGILFDVFLGLIAYRKPGDPYRELNVEVEVESEVKSEVKSEAHVGSGRIFTTPKNHAPADDKGRLFHRQRTRPYPGGCALLNCSIQPG